MSMSPEQIEAFLETEFPQVRETYGDIHVEQAGDMKSVVRIPFSDNHLRPGGTISGPTMMMLTDLAFYVAILGVIGTAHLAVTTNLNINFLRKPGHADLIAEAEILKLGKRLAVGQVTIRSEGETGPVAHATLTYSIPEGIARQS
ncbi:MAG: phenylacetic acid degradation protein [Hyphomicrobiales bacterium]|nr:MAG: phenylacetic acid degradation protein [Hyphomicrobiales bacterium]